MAEFNFATRKPRVFIGHGTNRYVRDYVAEFLLQLEFEPYIVEKMPDNGMNLSDKIDWYLRSADCCIIIATSDNRIEGEKSEYRARQNVIHELSKAQELFPRRTIYLWEEGVEVPSNVQVARSTYKKDSFEQISLILLRELKAMGFLSASRLDLPNILKDIESQDISVVTSALRQIRDLPNSDQKSCVIRIQDILKIRKEGSIVSDVLEKFIVEQDKIWHPLRAWKKGPFWGAMSFFISTILAYYILVY